MIKQLLYRAIGFWKHRSPSLLARNQPALQVVIPICWHRR